MKSILENKLPIETEILSKTDSYNEYIMTGLRTIWGISLTRIEKEFGNEFLNYILQQSEKFIENNMLEIVATSDLENQNRDEKILKTTLKGKFFCDGIASDLFLLNLK